jgi:hypothetical protein
MHGLWIAGAVFKPAWGLGGDDVQRCISSLSILRQFLGLLGFCFGHHLFLCVLLLL